MLQLDFSDHRPLYEQICDKIKELIITGVLEPDEKIPSVRELAATLAINPNTIQKAYKELENEGFIYSQKARGSFVSPTDSKPDLKRIHELTASVEHTVRELKFLGAKENELISLIKNIYKEEQP